MSKPKNKKQKTTASIDDIPFGQMGHVAYDQSGNPVKVHAPKGDPDSDSAPRETEHGPVNHTPSDRDWKPVEGSRPPAPEETDDEDEDQDEEDSADRPATKTNPTLTSKEFAFLKLFAHASTCHTPGCTVEVDWGENCGYLADIKKWPLCAEGKALRAKV